MSPLMWSTIKSSLSILVTFSGDVEMPQQRVLIIEYDYFCLEYTKESSNSGIVRFKAAVPGNGVKVMSIPWLMNTEHARSLVVAESHRHHGKLDEATRIFDSLTTLFKNVNRYTEAAICAAQSFEIQNKRPINDRKQRLESLSRLCTLIEGSEMKLLDSIVAMGLHYRCSNILKDLAMYYDCKKECLRWLEYENNFGFKGYRLAFVYYQLGNCYLSFGDVDYALGCFYKSDQHIDLLDSVGTIRNGNLIGKCLAYIIKGNQPASEYYCSRIREQLGGEIQKRQFLEGAKACMEYYFEFDPLSSETVILVNLVNRNYHQWNELDKAFFGGLIGRFIILAANAKNELIGISKVQIKELIKKSNDLINFRSPISSELSLNMARIYYLQGELDSALIWYHKAVIQNHDNYDNPSVLDFQNTEEFIKKIEAPWLMKEIIQELETTLWDKAKELERYGNDAMSKVYRRTCLGNLWLLIKLQSHLQDLSHSPQSRTILAAEFERSCDLFLKESVKFIGDYGENQEELGNLMFSVCQATKSYGYSRSKQEYHGYHARRGQLGLQLNKLLVKKQRIVERILISDGNWNVSSLDSTSKAYVKLLEVNSEIEQMFGASIRESPHSWLSRSIQIKNVSERLNKDLTLIEIYCGSRAFFVCAIADGRFVYSGEDWNEVKQKKLERLANLLATRPNESSIEKQDSLAYLLHWCYQQVLGGIDQYDILKENLLISCDGVMSRIPIEALIQSRPGTGSDFSEWEFMVKSKNISYIVSTDLWLDDTKNKEPIQPVKKLQAFSTFCDGTENFAELWPLTDALTHNLQHGSNCNPTQFFKLADESDILLMQCHSILDETNPYATKLLLNSGDGYDQVSNIYLRSLPYAAMKCELAILQACETGSGSFRKGDGPISLSRMFLQAGVKRVVSATSKIPISKSNTIISSFQTYLLDGENVGQSLTQAKRDYMNSVLNNNDLHPYYWSGLVFHGLDTPIFEKKNPWKIYWFLLIIPTGVLVFFIYRRRNSKRKSMSQAA